MEDIAFCSRAIITFRPNINLDNLIGQTLKMMEEGFHIAYISNNENTEAAAFVGFRTFEMYRTGTIIYIDDLFTFEENRGKGYAGALLDYVHNFALEAGIQTVHLDSGYDLHPAHRLYLNKGYILPCHHFVKVVKA